MSFTLIESLNTIGHEIEIAVRCIMESVESHPDRDTIIETADSVLGQLVTKLKTNSLKPEEADEYAQLYASLSLLAQDTVRQALNINLASPTGKQKFANVVNKVGDVPGMTAQVKKVAQVNGQSHYKQILRDLQGFSSMDPQKQSQYINSVNKLRIGYERVKNQLSSEKPGVDQPQQAAQTGGQTSNSSQTNNGAAPNSTPGQAAPSGGGTVGSPMTSSVT
jgi:hypothetical protein